MSVDVIGTYAPKEATYITQTASGSLTNEQALSSLTTGMMYITNGTGVISTATAGTEYVAPGGALGTPSSGTLTNCTGLPLTGLVDDTTTALGVGSIELGHASDTTIARSGAGAITVEGVQVILSGAALGTPSSGSLANCDDYPGATDVAFSALTVDVGNADTTIGRTSAGVINVEGTDVLLDGGALGTPSGGTLTNCTGLPLTGLVDDTSTALGVGSIELGHASDTSITRVSAGVVAVEGVNIVMTGGALGTPTSGTLTNCTGLPLTGLVDDTTTALGVGSIELGHASDTTLSRSAAGVLAVEGVVIPSISSTSTLTNKRVTQRVTTTASDTTAVIDTDTCDVYELTDMAGATVFTEDGGATPTDGQKLIVRVKDDGTSRALTWTIFTAIGVTLPAASTAGKWHYIGATYNSDETAWHAIAVTEEA